MSQKPWIRVEVARAGEMNPDIPSDVPGQGTVQASLRITIARDGDIAVYIDYDGIPVGSDGLQEGARVEFCNPSGGGGRSPRTRDALMQLIKAIEEDNQQHPEGLPRFPLTLHQHRT